MEATSTQNFTPSGVLASNWSVEIDAVSNEAWSAELEKFEDASIYQTSAYGEVSWGAKQLSRIVLKQAGVVVGLAQLRIVKVPILGRGIAYLRSGPVWRKRGQAPDPAVFVRLMEEIKAEFVQRRKLLLRIIPHVFSGDETESLYDSTLSEKGLQASKEATSYRTILLDISLPPEQLRKNLDQKWRNQLNRSERNELTVLEGTEERLYGMFKRIYNEMLDRKAFETSVDIDEFERIQKLLPTSQKIQIAIALKNDKPLSAVLSSSVGETGIYLLGATSNEGMQHKGSYLLQWRMIQTLKERGCRYYDLGGINPERNPGVYHFKSGFSGREVNQIGTFELSGSWLSSALVNFGERRKRKSARSAQPRNTVGSPAPALSNPNSETSPSSRLTVQAATYAARPQ